MARERKERKGRIGESVTVTTRGEGNKDRQSKEVKES